MSDDTTHLLQKTVFPIQVADHEGHTLTIERSDGRDPHPAPPGALEVWLRRPESSDGKPGGYLVSGTICQFFKNFNGNEEITQTQAERNRLKAEVVEFKKAQKETKKEVGQLTRRVAELEAQVAKERKEVRSDLSKDIITLMQAHLL